MRQQDHLAAFSRNLGNGRRDALEPRRVGDAAIVGGHVEVDAQQHALALHVDVIEGAESFCHWEFSCPGRCAAQSGALQNRDPCYIGRGVCGSRLCEAA